MKREVITYKDPKSPISEIFRTLRTNIQFMTSNKKLKTLLVTSTYPGEGKSWITSNLAVAFAQMGKKVIIVDADMRKGRQYVLFATAPRPGLSNYLSGINSNEDEKNNIEEYIQETEVENLYLIPSGSVPPNPSELLLTTHMISLLDELKKLCDIIIIDGTPCELVTDSIILSRIVDSTVIVTAHKQTKKDSLQKIVKNMQNVGGNLAGIVLNKIPIANKKYSERYYYNFNVEEQNINNTLAKNYSTQIKRNINNGKRTTTKKENKNVKKSHNKVSTVRTNDILKQINEYLDEQNK